MRKISRSSHAAFSECTRRGYLGYAYKGTGLGEPKGVALCIGLVVHKGMELMLKGCTDDQALMDGMEAEWLSQGQTLDQFKDEQNLALARGLVLAWKRVHLQGFLNQYEILMVEEEMQVLLAPNLTLQARADCVTRDRGDGSVLVWNWKTSGSVREWTQQWTFDIQAMTEALAVQEHLGEYVQGCVFEGFSKGGVYGGVSTSPLITGYTDGSGVWEAGGKARGKEWSKRSTWREFQGGTPRWLDFIGSLCSESFVRSAVILKNDEAVREWLKEVVRYETDVERMLDPEVSEEDRLTFFRKNPGRRCQWCRFAASCWSGIPVDALGLDVREDHHPSGSEGEQHA
jgi:hypothetical protein